MSTAGGATVISGPTAVGKGTVVRALQASHPEVWVSVSATTRPPRPQEVHGRDYVFLSDAEFDRLVAAGGLLEWAEVHGAARYGTPKAPFEQALASGRPVILEIDLQGARQVKKALPDASFVFIAPPSWQELVRRLQGRGTESATAQQQRLQTARAEMAAMDEFDHVVVNADVRQAVEDLVSLLGL